MFGVAPILCGLLRLVLIYNVLSSAEINSYSYRVLSVFCVPSVGLWSVIVAFSGQTHLISDRVLHCLLTEMSNVID